MAAGEGQVGLFRTMANAGLLGSNEDSKPPRPHFPCKRSLHCKAVWLLVGFPAYQNQLTSRNPGVSHLSLTYSRKHGTSVGRLVCQLDTSRDYLGSYLSRENAFINDSHGQCLVPPESLLWLLLTMDYRL